MVRIDFGRTHINSLLILCICIDSSSTPFYSGTADSVETPIVNFTSKPDESDLTVFVGKGKASVTFRWTYVVQPEKYLKYIKFGYVEEKGTLQAVVVKTFREDQQGKVIKLGSEVSRKDRITTGKDRKAEFTFKDLRLSDSGEYFCSLFLAVLTKHSVVRLRVEGKSKLAI